MRITLLALLRCPDEGQGLELTSPYSAANGMVESGELRCSACRRTYPIVAGVPCFVTDDGYLDSFGFEWEKHARTQLVIDRERTQMTFRRLGFAREPLAGTLVLDAGCGVGRYMVEVLDCGGEVVGVDMSRSIFHAAANLRAESRAHFVRADIMRLPFAHGAFDHVFAVGVLHHTPDPAAAFSALVSHVRPGGSITISVYPQGPGLYEDCKRWRPLTTRMDKRLLYAACSLSALVLYPVYRVPIIRSFFHYLPISMHPNYEWRRLDTFDAYAPRFASTHTYHEVYTWFRQAGLREIEVLPVQVSLRGWKPA